VRKKQVSLDMIPVLERIQQALDIKSQLDGAVDKGNYSTALEMCSQCLLLLEECSELSAVQEMNQSIEVQFTSCEPFYSSLAFCILLCQV
jgi:hypothetical protein